MTCAQPGIFAVGTRSHHHLELDLLSGAGAGEVRSALGALRGTQPDPGALNLVVGFGAAALGRLAPAGVPEHLAPFAPIEGPGGRGVPSTQCDLWVWLHGTGPDVVLDAARSALSALAPVARLVRHQPAFAYRDGRDMTGFVDGTENPPVEEAPEVALVPEGAVGAGGSYVLVMRWVHDLGAFSALSLAEQEAVIGRTKDRSVDLGDSKPPTAHISRVVIEEDGEELEIFRRSTPFGDVTTQGLCFVAFSADPGRFTRMLGAMFGTAGDGLHDRLTEFSRPDGAGLYFAPSLDALAGIGR